MIKYLFKYVNKGIDRIRAMIIENVLYNDNIGEHRYEHVDEIKTFLDYRYFIAYKLIHMEIISI